MRIFATWTFRQNGSGKSIHNKKLKKYIVFSNLKSKFNYFNNSLYNTPYIKVHMFLEIQLK